MPPLPMSSPASTKNGTAMSGKESAAVTRPWAMYVGLTVPEVKMVTRLERPREIPIGSLRIRKMTKEPNKISVVIIDYPPLSRS